MDIYEKLEKNGIQVQTLAQLHDDLVAQAVKVYDKGRDVQPQLYMVELKEDGTYGKIASLPRPIMASFFGSEVGKDAFAAFLREVLTEGHPVRTEFEAVSGFEPSVLVQIAEAWTVQMEQGEQLRGSVSSNPRRQEILLVSVHTRFGSIPVMHDITRKPKAKCHVKPFPGPDTSALSYGGRFSI